MRKFLTMKDGRRFWIEKFTGEVSDAAKSKEMEIKSPAHGIVESQMEARQEFWLNSYLLEDRFFRLPNDVLPVRDGDLITVFYGAVQDKQEGVPLGVYHHGTKKFIHFMDGDDGKTTYLSACGYVHSQALFVFSALGILSIIGIPIVLLIRFRDSFKRERTFFDWRKQVATTIDSFPVSA